MNDSSIIGILENQENGVLIINYKKEVISINQITRNLLGSDMNQLLGNYTNCHFTNIEKVNCQETTRCSSCVLNKTIDAVIQSQETQILDDIIITKNDTRIKLSIKISSHLDKYILLELFNLNIKKEQMNFLVRLADKSRDIMFFKNNKLRYVYLNKKYAEFLGKDKDYIIGKKDIDLVNENLLPIELYGQCYDSDMETLKNGYYSGIETMGELYFRTSKENIYGGILCLARDITDEMNAIKKSETDQLTGLYNRSKFDEKINEIYINNKKDYSLALIDLDDLRNLNNKYGHLKGDEYLRIIGKILKQNDQGIFFRIGGDEFAGIIDNKINSTKSVLENVFKEINSLNLQPKLSISIGASILDISRDYVENYERIDKLLYESKNNGKGRFIINNE